jgi:hypothetical protein
MVDEQGSVQDFATKSQAILFEATCVFPFNFFPDKIIIDRVKVSVVERHFWGEKETVSILHGDVLSANAHSYLFLASLTIMTRTFTARGPIEIHALKVADAFRARRILQGMAIARNQEMSLDELTDEELLKTVEQIGESHVETA